MPGRVAERLRTNPWWAVAVACGAILVCAWIGWAIHVASDHGAREGIGVLVAWPAMLAGLVLVALPFVGLYLLIRRLLPDDDKTVTAPESSEDS